MQNRSRIIPRNIRDSEDDHRHQSDLGLGKKSMGEHANEDERECMQDKTTLSPAWESLRHSPDLISWTVETQVVGSRHRDKTSPDASSNELLEKPLIHGPLVLIREEDNDHDIHAIKISTASSSQHLGYLPRTISLRLAPLLDAREAEASCSWSTTSSTADPLPSGKTFSWCIKLSIKEVKYGSRGFELEPPSPYGLSSRRERLITTLQLILAAAEQRSEKTGTILHTSFNTMVQTALAHDSHLLISDEMDMMATMLGMPEAPLGLLLRLFLRKATWFRVESLRGQYEEVEDIEGCLDSLIKAGLMIEPSLSDDHKEESSWRHCASHLLPLSDLRSLASSRWFKLSEGESLSALTRSEIIQRERDRGTGEDPERSKSDFESVMVKLGRCVRLSVSVVTLIKRIQRIFFLDPELDLSRFVAAQKNVTPYPCYEIIRSSECHVFASRDDLLLYEESLGLHDLIASELSSDKINDKAVEEGFEIAWTFLEAEKSRREDKEIAVSLITPFFDRFSAPFIYTRVLWWAVSFYEKRKRYQKAVMALQLLLSGPCNPSKRGVWSTRLSIDFEHLGDIEGALVASEKALLDPRVRHGDRLGHMRRVIRLGKPPRRWKKPNYAADLSWEPKEVVISSQPLTEERGVKSQFRSLFDPIKTITVEQLALEHYSTESGGSWRGAHSEGGVWSSLFGLLFWDVIFSPVPEVFRSKFQSAPLDFGSDAFYETRRSSIDIRLGEIASGQASSLLGSTWSKHQGQWCKGVNWNHFSLKDLVEICSCVGPIGLSFIMRMLAEDYRGVRGGMPDLLLWSTDDKGVGRAMLSEVKGQNDRLSESQRAWTRALSEAEVKVEVLKVSFGKAAGAKSKGSSNNAEPREEGPAEGPAEVPAEGHGEGPTEGKKKEEIEIDTKAAVASSSDPSIVTQGSKRQLAIPILQYSNGTEKKKRQSSIDGFFSPRANTTFPSNHHAARPRKECIDLAEPEIIEID